MLNLFNEILFNIFAFFVNSLRPSDPSICVSKLTIIGSDNGLSPGRRQAIIWTNAGILLIEPLGTNFSGILIEILAFSFKKMHLKVWSGKRRPFCLGLNVLILNTEMANAVEIHDMEDKNLLSPVIPPFAEFCRHGVQEHNIFLVSIYSSVQTQDKNIAGPAMI